MKTQQGRMFQARVMADPASTGTGDYSPACIIGVSTDESEPNDENTELAGEVVVGTMVRAPGAWAYNDGARSYTLVRTVTADREITLVKAGVFNEAGTLIFENFLDSSAILRSGDVMLVTQTVVI